MQYVSAAARGIALLVILVAPLGAQQPTAVATSPAITLEQWRADLRILMEELPRRHKNVYHTISKATLDSAAAALDARIPGLARHQIIAGMMRIVALVGDGHTNIYPTRDSIVGFHALPVTLYLFKDGLYVRSAESSHSDIVGARVLRIGEATAEEAYVRVRPYVGRDNEMGARFWAPYLLAMPEILHATGLSSSADSARFEIESGGRRRTVWLKPAGLVRMMAPDTDASWWPPSGYVDARARSGSAPPLWLSRRPDSTMWWFITIPGTRTGYAQISQVRNGADESFEDFTSRLLQFTDTARLDKLVIDLRLNRGGSGSLLKPLVRGLLRRPGINSRGKLFVITGRSTWSAAQFLVNDLHEFSEAIFVGEPSGSKGNHFGDSRRFTLPNSGITVRASSLYWQDWHPLDTRAWIGPDVAAELSFADYASNRDPAVEAIRAYVPEPPLRERLRILVAADDTAGARRAFTAFRGSPARSFVDAHTVLDEVALSFLYRKDSTRATWVFALAAAEYPGVLRSHLNLAVMYRETGRAELERESLLRALRLAPSHAGVLARLRALGERP